MTILLLSNQVHALVIKMSQHQEWLIEMEFHATFKENNGVHGCSRVQPKQIEVLESFVSGRDSFVSLPTEYGKSIILLEVVPVISRQRSHTSDLNSALLISLASNVHQNLSYVALNGSCALINTHQPLVALVNLRPVNCSRPLERGYLYCKR